MLNTTFLPLHGIAHKLQCWGEVAPPMPGGCTQISLACCSIFALYSVEIGTCTLGEQEFDSIKCSALKLNSYGLGGSVALSRFLPI